MTEHTLETLLAARVAELEIALPEPASARLCQLAELVCEWGRTTNLTGHRSPEQVLEKLILDALALSQELPAFETLADLGSGAGFPGLPMAIRYPERHFILVESRMRRHHFQRAAIRSLELTNVEPLRGRIESVDATECDVVIAQALAAPSAALDLARRWTRPGGWVAIPGTEATAAKLENAAAKQAASYRLARYQVPDAAMERTLLIARMPEA